MLFVFDLGARTGETDCQTTSW